METSGTTLKEIFEQFEAKSTEVGETAENRTSPGGISISAGSIGKIIVINRQVSQRRQPRCEECKELITD